MQDDSGEQGEVEGVHLQPLVLVLVPCTPGSIVQIAIVNARLKKKTRVTLEICCKLQSIPSYALPQCEALHKILVLI